MNSTALVVSPDLSTFDGQRQHYAAVHGRLFKPDNAANDETKARVRPVGLRLSAGLPYAISRPAPEVIVGPRRERTTNPTLRRAPTMEVPPWLAIMREVAAKHGLTEFDIEGFNRTRPYCAARHEAMWRMSTELGMSLPVMARKFGNRDHTTLIHGIRSHALIVSTPRGRDILMLGTGAEDSQSPQDIIDAVAAKHNVTIAQIKGNQQSILISGARQEIYWRLSTVTNLSTVEIGQMMNRDHSTVVIGIRRHIERMAQE